jgi:hypothetical protein
VKYAVELCSVAMMHIPSFIKTRSCIQKLMEGVHTQTDGRDLCSTLLRWAQVP